MCGCFIVTTKNGTDEGRARSTITIFPKCSIEAAIYLFYRIGMDGDTGPMIEIRVNRSKIYIERLKKVC